MANALLELVFGKVRGEALKAGPYSVLRFEDGTLLADGERLAVHENHQWVTEQSRYTRIDVDARIDIRCYTSENASRTFGPYATFSSVDGVAYVEQRASLASTMSRSAIGISMTTGGTGGLWK